MTFEIVMVLSAVAVLDPPGCDICTSGVGLPPAEQLKVTVDVSG